MSSLKRSISFSSELLREAERAAARAPYEGNLSRLVNDAVRRHLKLQALRKLVAEHEREHGAITDTERATVDAKWPA